MGISEDTFICGEINDREQMIEDLAFLSDRGNYKSIKYAIECIDKLAKIEQITDKWITLEENSTFCMREIREVLNG